MSASAPLDENTTSAPGLRWIGAVVGMLAFTIGSQSLLLSFALGDPSVVAEPDYYQKAVDWDAHRAQARANDQLGWTLVASFDGDLRVRLADREGRGLDRAAVRVQTFHKARARHVLEGSLADDAEGRYRAALPFDRAGIWELRFEVERDGETFTHTAELELEPADRG